MDLHDQLLDQIIYGQIEPGEKIIELDFAKKFKTSRTPLREALFQLESEGFLEYKANYGFRVKDLSAETIREIYPIIWTLEVLALKQSGTLVKGVLDQLTKINTKFKKSLSNPSRAYELDREWHDVLLSKCPNHELLEIIKNLKLKIKRYDIYYMEDQSLSNVSYQQHQAIIKALECNQRDKAEKSLEENWKFGMEKLLITFGSVVSV